MTKARNTKPSTRNKGARERCLGLRIKPTKVAQIERGSYRVDYALIVPTAKKPVIIG